MYLRRIWSTRLSYAVNTNFDLQVVKRLQWVYLTFLNICYCRLLPFAKGSFGSVLVGRKSRTRPKADARGRKLGRLLPFTSTKLVLGEAHLFGFHRSQRRGADYFDLEMKARSVSLIGKGTDADGAADRPFFSCQVKLKYP